MCQAARLKVGAGSDGTMFEPPVGGTSAESKPSGWPRPLRCVEVAGFTKVGALYVMSARESCMRPERHPGGMPHLLIAPTN